ncbi:MAG TPA: ATP-binding protein [Myxococcaceae bacterium]|nr:ATP-binding protein [Myxococcaceae bacterium]
MLPLPTPPPRAARAGSDFLSDPTLLLMVGAATFELGHQLRGVRLSPEAASVLFGCPEQTEWDAEDFITRLLPPEERERVVELLWKVVADGEPRTLEHRAHGPRGDVRWMRTAVVITERRTLRCLTLDVTESHRNKALWRELEVWLSALGEALPFDFWICDRHERLVLMSPSFAQRWQALPGQKFSELELPPELMLSWKHSRLRALKGERSSEQLVLPSPEQTLTFTRTVSPVRDGETIYGVLGVDVDVTELREAERRVRQSLLDVAQAQQELVRKEHVAALGEMAAIVAHEVRHPLGAICNAIALLRRSDTQQDPQGQLLTVMEEEAFRLELLVQHMLELARPHRPELRQQRLSPILEDVLKEVFDRDDGDIRVHVGAFLNEVAPPLELDAERLTLALANVIRNAKQAMPRGGDLYIDGFLSAEGEQRHLVLTLRDTGEGVPEGLIHRLFEPFFTTRSEGAGMGLVVARRVLTEHGGRFDLQSREGEGTTVTLRLPLPRSEDAQPDAHPD